jgi:hypothetical protein
MIRARYRLGTLLRACRRGRCQSPVEAKGRHVRCRVHEPKGTSYGNACCSQESIWRRGCMDASPRSRRAVSGQADTEQYHLVGCRLLALSEFGILHPTVELPEFISASELIRTVIGIIDNTCTTNFLTSTHLAYTNRELAKLASHAAPRWQQQYERVTEMGNALYLNLLLEESPSRSNLDICIRRCSCEEVECCNTPVL